MTFGTPLMYWQGQEGQADDITETMKAVATQFPKLGKKDAVLIMAHGTPHPSNAYYAVMQDRLNELGYTNAYIFSVEGWPHLDTVTPQLKAKGIKNVTLMPLMMVAITIWPVTSLIPLNLNCRLKASRLTPISTAWAKTQQYKNCLLKEQTILGMLWKLNNLLNK